MRKSKLAGGAVSIVAAVALIYLVLSSAGIEGIKDSLKSINYWWIALSVVLYTLDEGLEAKRWSCILRDNSLDVGLKDAFFAFNLGNSINITVPAKLGDVARSYYLKKEKGYGYSRTLPSTLLDRFFDVIGVYVVTLLTGIYVVSAVKLPDWLFTLMIVGIVVLVAAFVAIGLLLRNKKYIESIRRDKLRCFMESLIEVLEGSIKHKGKFVMLTFMSVVLWTLEGIVSFTVILSLDVNINPIVITFVSMIATLTKVIPVTPGGIGVFEGAMTVLLVMFGIGISDAAVIATVNHLIMNLYTLIIGVFVIVTKGMSISKIKSEKVD
jgi:uncharacterized protein (TIRG00374 family)